jgi:tetratricopeptide (TPR) repeat protein
MTEQKGENSNTDLTRGLLEQARAALAMGFMSRSHEAFSRQKIEQAQALVRKILAQDPHHKEARSLLREIERASGARREEQKQRGRDEEKATAASHNSEVSAVGADPTLIVRDSGRGKVRRILGWVALAALLLGVSFGAVHLIQQRSKQQSKPLLDVASQIVVAKSNLSQRHYDQAIEVAQAILSVSPGNTDAQAILSEAQKQKRQARIDILMVEAQNLRSQNRLEDANQTIQRVLDIDPSNQPALAVRSQIESETAASKGKEEQDSQIQLWSANADTFLIAGKLPEARSEIRKIERLRPDAPQLELLRKRLNAQAAAAARNQQKEQQAAEQKEKMMIGDLGRRAEELFRQGRYAETKGITEQWLAAAPRGTDAQSLQARTLEALAALKTYEVCLAAKDYEGALGALLRLEKGNPSDPNIAELRRRAELKNADAKATLSVYRLGDPGVLILDGQQFGTGGEVEKKVVKGGRHKIEVKGSNGKQASREIVFLDGQDLTMVYDLTTAELRPMIAADRDAINRRRQPEIHRFPVEHLHGFLKGKCTGELLISSARIDYKSKERQHDLSLPLRSLNLTVKDEKLDFTQSSGDDRYQFRARDPVQASSIKNLWRDLQRTGK